jgi:hypothetical protein
MIHCFINKFNIFRIIRNYSIYQHISAEDLLMFSSMSMENIFRNDSIYQHISAEDLVMFSSMSMENISLK